MEQMMDGSGGQDPSAIPSHQNVPPQIPVIEFHMMHMEKYVPLTLLSGFTIRTCLYPFSVVRTRLQIQRHKEIYNGTLDALKKIYCYEGARGLYRGYWVSQLQIAPQTSYILTYEGVRHMLSERGFTDTRFKSFVAGGSASFVSQCLVVPTDVISQHLMLMGVRSEKSGGLGHLKLPDHCMNSAMGRTRAVVRAIYKRDGLLGFYRGFFTSLAVYAPNSALWWTFYDSYCSFFGSIYPESVPRLALQCMAACSSAVTTSCIMNPLDLTRTRVQVEAMKFVPAAKQLWEEEHLRVLTKGLSARLVQSIMFSFCIILGYESLKRFSIKDEYRDKVEW